MVSHLVLYSDKKVLVCYKLFRDIQIVMKLRKTCDICVGIKHFEFYLVPC